MITHSLVNNLTEHSVREICFRYQSTGISSALLQANGIKELIQKYVEITQPFKNTNIIKHNTKYYIETTGQLIHSTPRQLKPDKYKIAKAEFQQMLQLGIIRPSKSAWSSSLHMVQKSNMTA